MSAADDVKKSVSIPAIVRKCHYLCAETTTTSTSSTTTMTMVQTIHCSRCMRFFVLCFLLSFSFVFALAPAIPYGHRLVDANRYIPATHLSPVCCRLFESERGKLNNHIITFHSHLPLHPFDEDVFV